MYVRNNKLHNPGFGVIRVESKLSKKLNPYAVARELGAEGNFISYGVSRKYNRLLDVFEVLPREKEAEVVAKLKSDRHDVVHIPTKTEEEATIEGFLLASEARKRLNITF